MTPAELTLVAAAIGGLAAALVNVIANYYLQKSRLKDERLKVASELVRMKYENLKWTVEKAQGPVETYVMTPALELLRAIRAVDEIADQRKWKGEAEALKWEDENIPKDAE